VPSDSPISGRCALWGQVCDLPPKRLVLAVNEMNFMKTKEKSLAKILMALVLALPLSAQSQTAFGIPDCGEWINTANNLKRGWLLGYMSGLNAMHVLENLKPEDPLRKLNSADQAFLWMDNYCKTNPLKTVGHGGWELFKELGKK
jgi:hypothetical protein